MNKLFALNPIESSGFSAKDQMTVKELIGILRKIKNKNVKVVITTARQFSDGSGHEDVSVTPLCLVSDSCDSEIEYEEGFVELTGIEMEVFKKPNDL